jgi:hypothetical protein
MNNFACQFIDWIISVIVKGRIFFPAEPAPRSGALALIFTRRREPRSILGLPEGVTGGDEQIISPFLFWNLFA